MSRPPCAGTENGAHVLSRQSVRTELLPLGGVDTLAIAASCAACGLHCGWIVDIPFELTWTNEPPSLEKLTKLAMRCAPKATLTLIEGGKTDD